MTERQAGAFAEQRYKQGLRNYRRRMRPQFLALMAAGVLSYTVVYLVRGLDWWSFSAGLAAAAFISAAMWLRDDPPEFIAKWGRGAEGERKTAKAIEPLLKQGWKARHDIDIGYGNADHLLLSPGSTAFLLETKTLAGQISIEHGHLTCRFVDDPDATRRYRLEKPVQALTERVTAEWSRRTGRPAPTIHPVVVIWGAFADRLVETPKVSYVAGEDLCSYVLARASKLETRILAS